MWGFKKKKAELPDNLPAPPSPDGPELPMPEPVTIPKISGRDLELRGSNESSMEMPEDNFDMMPPLEMDQGLENPSQPIQSDFGLENGSSEGSNMEMPKPQYVSIPSSNSFSKYHYVKDDGEDHKNFLFLEKSNYSHIVDELKDISLMVKESRDIEPKIIDIKDKEDLIYAEFSEGMEEVQRKLVYVDKTLFGE